MKSKQVKCRGILKEKGIYLNNTRLSEIREDDLLFLKNLIENDELKPVVDRIYSMTDIVEAHRYVDKGHKKGNVIITICEE